MNAPLRKFGNLCGLLAPLLWASAIIYCGSVGPEFSHYGQYISELGERGSSTELIMRYAGFVPTGLMHLRGLSLYSVASGAAGLVFLLLMVWSAEARAGTGLYERLSSGVLSLWVFVVAARMWSAPSVVSHQTSRS